MVLLVSSWVFSLLGDPWAVACASACWSFGPWVVLVAGLSMSWLLVMLAKVEDASVVGGSEAR